MPKWLTGLLASIVAGVIVALIVWWLTESERSLIKTSPISKPDLRIIMFTVDTVGGLQIPSNAEAKVELYNQGDAPAEDCKISFYIHKNTAPWGSPFKWESWVPSWNRRWGRFMGQSRFQDLAGNMISEKFGLPPKESHTIRRKWSFDEKGLFDIEAKLRCGGDLSRIKADRRTRVVVGNPSL